MPNVLIENAADRVRITLDRPTVHNALDLQTVQELHDACALVERDPRPVILRGNGPSFAAGADLREMRWRGRDEALDGINSTLFRRLRALPMPVVALVHGRALGGGAELAYACDFRFGTPDTTFANPEVGLGILAAAGAAWRLKSLVGETTAFEMLLGGRSLRGEEALAAGLLSRLHAEDELWDEGESFVDSLCALPRTAVRLSKLALTAPREAHPWVDDLAQAVLFETDDKARLMDTFLTRHTSGDRA